MQRLIKIVLGLFSLITSSALAQNSLSKYAVDASIFYGSTLEHNSEIAHLLSEHPTGFLLSWNKTLNPKDYWSYKNRYPELGFSFSYHQSHLKALGRNYGLYGHINWYFASRYLQLKLAQGIAYADNPYHPDKNYRNNAYGSRLLSATRLELSFIKQNIWQGVGIHTGLGIVHYSNGGTKRPNTSANTWYAHIGVRYHWDEVQIPDASTLYWDRADELTTLRYEVIVRGGRNQAGIGMPKRGFFVLSSSLGKRWTFRSGWRAGVEYFLSPFLNDHIRFRSVAYPEYNISDKENPSRVGVFAGYDMYVSDALSLFVDLGYYVYWPFEYERRYYNRAGIKYQINEGPFFALIDVKAHYSRAESLELGVGYRFL